MLYSWKIALSEKHFRNRFISSMVILLIVLTGFASLLAYIETRQGHVVYDPVLNFIKPRDVSYFIFFTTYTTALVAIIYALSSTYKFLHLIQMYGTLTLLRVLTLFFVPLESPIAIIPLHDEILKHTFYSGGENIKDLFFSGHAATLFLFYFFSVDKVLKYLFLAAAISVSISLVVQHAHYSFDILAAPVFAYISYKLVTKFSKHYYKEVAL